MPKGHAVTGFYFMEMGYGEYLRLAIDSGFKLRWIAGKSGNVFCVRKDRFGLKNYKKTLQELLIGKIDNALVRSVLLCGGIYDCYILEK